MSLPISNGGRRYGRLYDRYDRRDLMMSSAPIFRAKMTQLPPVGDNRQWQGPIKDQGQEGSCTGHAYSSNAEWAARRYMDKTPIFSPQYTYVSELLLEGTFPEDNGAMPRSGCIVTVKSGLCESSVFPYVEGQIVKPNAAQIANAETWKFMGAYHRINTVDDALSCCADKFPWLFTIGFMVYDSFESDQTAETGVMPVPNKAKEQLLGGHEVLGGLAWDTGTIPKLRPKGCPPAVLVQNSWSKDWGIHGNFWMPLEVLDDPEIVSDMWIIHNGGPWIPKR